MVEKATVGRLAFLGNITKMLRSVRLFIGRFHMTSRTSRSNGSLILLVVMLTSAVLPWVAPVRRVLHAALNCQTRQCVEVRYKAKSAIPGVDPRNIYCVRYSDAFGVHIARAYSARIAVSDCYGQESVGGTPSEDRADQVDGHYWEVVCVPDCLYIPDHSKCSGIVAEYLSEANTDTFPTKCKVGYPPPPEPDPEPDP